MEFQKEFCQDILKICKPLFDRFNVNFFSHVRSYRNGNFASLMTSTDLSEYYMSKKYPVRFNHGKGYFLDSGFYIEKYLGALYSERLNQELREKFNTDHFIYVIDKNVEYEDMYTFATFPEESSFVNEFINHLPEFKHFILYYKGRGESIIKKCNLHTYSREYFEVPTAVLANQKFVSKAFDQSEFFNKMPLKKININLDDYKNIMLSKQEFECFKYAIKYFTNKEIGRALQLSPRTVETYINNLKNKLGCHTRSELVEMASQINLWPS